MVVYVTESQTELKSIYVYLLFVLQLLIGFECGFVVLWDLKSKKADYRYNYDEVIFCFKFNSYN